METTYTQTIIILYKYFYIWELDLRLNNINFHRLSLFIIPYYHWYLYWYLLLLSSLLNLWITSKPLKVHPRFRYYKQVSSSFCDSSLILILIQGFFLNLTLWVLNCNIKTQFLFFKTAQLKILSILSLYSLSRRSLVVYIILKLMVLYRYI